MNSNNIFQLISITASIHSLLLALYFFTRKYTKHKEHIIFGFILLIFSLLIISNSLSTRYELLVKYGKEIYLSKHLSLIIIPLVFIYINVILTSKIYTLKDYLKHFALFIITTPILLSILAPIKNFDIYFSNLRFVSGFLILFQNIYYFACIYKLIKKEKTNKNKIEKIKWSKALLIGFLFIWMVQFCSYVLIDIYREYYICPYTIGMYFITAFVIIYVIVFFLIETSKITSHKPKYKDSTISDNKINAIFHRIKIYFDEEKPYLDNEFTILKLSKQLQIPVKQISQAINSLTQGNFNSFVNNYRLEESKRLLHEVSKEELSVSQICFNVGFNSRSSFYESFKKKYGQTPSDLRKNNIILATAQMN